MSRIRRFFQSLRGQPRSKPSHPQMRGNGDFLGSKETTDGDSASMFSVMHDEDLESVLRYLLTEVSELRTLTRHLLAESPRYSEFVRETSESFDFQWGHIKEGATLRTDPAFLKSCRSFVTQYTGFHEAWFRGKRVLDAGCGNGRWAATFCDLGASVTAFDISEHGIADTTQACAGRASRIFRHSVLQPIPIDEPFDLVWSYGVLHHTGDTYGGFKNLLPMVRPGGFLFLMLYGEPRPWVSVEYQELNLYQRMRWHLRGLSSKQKVQYLQGVLEPSLVHGYFDAVSLPVNDCYGRSEILGWMRHAGFADIKETFENRNIHVIGQMR